MRSLLAALRRYTGRTMVYSRRLAAAFGVAWRRSLQVRVVISTLVLSAAVVFVLGMVLQYQILDRLVKDKRVAALTQAKAAVSAAQSALSGANPGGEDIRIRMSNALNGLASVNSDGDATTSAGEFESAMANATLDQPGTSVGSYAKVPESLRTFVLHGEMSEQIHTFYADGQSVTYEIIGAPVPTSSRPLQLYLLFPLTSEQATAQLLRTTLLVGAVMLLVLLAGIAALVTRQVVRPVRRAAEAAERFADGVLDERMAVVGEDDVARLAESYNQMAESIERQIRQLEEFGQLQRRFTSDVSHELRTPLTTVRMAADVLHASRKQFPAGLSRSTELLVDELDRFEALLGDLLEISRLDAGVEDLAPDYVDVAAIVRRAVESVRVIARRSGSKLELDLPEQETMAEVDARRVERILRNLLANAIDHGEGKPIQLRLGVSEDAVAVTVRDHGVGLRDGEADLVFNRFWRADPSRNRHTGGTGLGLAISLEDARLHGGGLDAWGEPGNGACFRLTLPRTQGVAYPRSPLPLRDTNGVALEHHVREEVP